MNMCEWLEAWNRQRLLKRKIARTEGLIDACLRDGALARNDKVGIPDARSIRRILVADTLRCFGDAMYVRGLMKELVSRFGERVEFSLLTSANLFEIYEGLDVPLLNFMDAGDCARASGGDFDVMIDLCYNDEGEWDFRKAFFGGLTKPTHVVTLSAIARRAQIFSSWLDVSDIRFADRLRNVVNLADALLSGDASLGQDKRLQAPRRSGGPVWPSLPCERERAEDWIYVNTRGRDADRVLSDAQISAVCAWFEGQDRYVGHFYVEGFDLHESSRVKRVRTKSYLDALRLMARCQGVISPDTSAVHAAVSMDIPVLAIYGSGKKEFPSGEDHSEVWGPLGERNVVLKSRFKEIGRIPVSLIRDSADRFVRSLDGGK